MNKPLSKKVKEILQKPGAYPHTLKYPNHASQKEVKSTSLEKKINALPKDVGVYLFKDINGRILYIGKALDLKKRVRSHFVRNNYFSAQFIAMAADLDWIVTRNEKEAFLLENELIKKYQPRHNIQWRDDKSYFWVRFTPDEWPRVIISHALKGVATTAEGQAADQDQKPKTLIGPFTNGRELRRVMRALRRIIPYRTCKNSYDKPCLQWHLGLCAAHKPHSKFKYPRFRPSVAGGGQKSKLKDNYLNSLNLLNQFLRLGAGKKIRTEAYDISNIQGKYATGSMIVFCGNKPSRSDYRKFRVKTVQGANDVAMIKEVLSRRLTHKEWSYPDLILIDGGKAQLGGAQLALDAYRLSLPLAALAKREEEIYTKFSDKAIHLSALPESMRLTFQAIRDEAHRFAIFYYRYLHEKRGFGKSHREIRKKRKNQG